MASKSRVGFGIWPTMPPGDAIKVARMAEDAGFDSVWVVESTLNPARDAISILGAMAALTSRIKLATGIINIYTRTPTLIASTMATLDELSSGRAILGLGTGHVNRLPPWHSVEFKGPLGRMKEYVEAIRSLLAGGTVSFEGRHVRIKGLKLGVRPVQEALKIFVASVGPRMARLAGRIADGVLLVNCTCERARALAEQAALGAQEASRQPTELEVACYLPTFIMPDYDESLKAAKALAAAYGASPFYRRLFREMGFGKEADLLEEAWAKEDRELALEAVSEALASSIYVVGDEEDLKKMVGDYRKAGITLPIVQPYYVEGKLEVNVVPSIRALA